MDNIVVRGARKNNLKGIDVDIPKNSLVVFTGVSGSGKSSLVFDTIAAESMRQLNDTFPNYIRTRLPHYADSEAEFVDNLNAAIVIRQRPFVGNARSSVATITDMAPLFRLLFSRCAENRLDAAKSYSYYDPSGMCPICHGYGKTSHFDPDKFLDKEKSLNQGAIKIPGFSRRGSMYWTLYADSGFFDVDKKLKNYDENEMYNLLHGSGPLVKIKGTGKVWSEYNMAYEGLLDKIDHLYLNKPKESLNKSGQKIVEQYAVEEICPGCNGTKYNELVRNSQWKGYNIHELCELEITELMHLCECDMNDKEEEIVKNIRISLQDIIDMGLGYLTMNRSARSLSAGELQRLRIIRHLKSSLVGLMYIFDEPSAGLHPIDICYLENMFVRLKNRGNSLLIVEHKEQIINDADYIVDMGPGSGAKGGEVVFAGDKKDFLNSNTITAQVLRRGKRTKRVARTIDSYFEIKGACSNNLKNVSVHIPYNALTVICGRAGAGKSTLACQELPDQHPDAIRISQQPIGVTSRSNLATYIGIMGEIRSIFAEKCGIEPAMFSYNSKGACPICGGRGVMVTDLVFLDNDEIQCESCGGSGFGSETLKYKVNGNNILDVLNMTVDQGIDYFNDFNNKKIIHKLGLLKKVGIGYCKLGQKTESLSGGESQRVKLAKYLKAKNSFYVIDEPTIGLHAKDTELLFELFDEMIDNGNTIVIVEHDLDLIERGDWIIELGPGGGKYGGKLLFEGKLEDMLKCSNSPTGEMIKNRPRKRDLNEL